MVRKSKKPPGQPSPVEGVLGIVPHRWGVEGGGTCGSCGRVAKTEVPLAHSSQPHSALFFGFWLAAVVCWLGR